MKRRNGVRWQAAVMLFGCLWSAILNSSEAAAQLAVDEPGGTPQAAALAAQDPDEFAWQLFLFINRQAQAGTAGTADPAKPTVKSYENDRDTVWETWALASRDGLPEAELFLAQGKKPVEWKALPRIGGAPKALDRTFTAGLPEFHVPPRSSTAPQFVITEPDSDEVRVNRPTFEKIREEGWFSREGLAATFAVAAAAKNPDLIQFPTGAKEVKARWEEIAESQKSRYHWRTIGGKTYGLRAFHIITKDLPMWFWTDFIHVDLEAAEPDPCRDTTTRGAAAAHGTGGVRRETVGSKWENYRLKGSQVSFADARGKPIVVGNQLIEFGNAATSSCMTCHAGAGIRKNGAPHTFGFITGLPPTTVFGTPDDIQVLQGDFLYSMVLRAHSTSEPSPSPTPAPAAVGGARPAAANIAPADGASAMIVEGFPDEVVNRYRQRTVALGAGLRPGTGIGLDFVITPLKRWVPGTTVKVAFKGGDAALHRQIADATNDWTSVANLKLDFGFNAATGRYRSWSTSDTSYQANIRVSFDQQGYWSVVGRESSDPTIRGPGEASLNLSGFDQGLPADWRGVVLHEFGHALGFQHEHQSPRGDCENDFRFDDDPGYVPTRDRFGQFVTDSAGRRPGLYTMLGGPPNNWSRDTVDFNLRQLPNSSAFEASTFDKDSIMKYYFPAWMFKQGVASPCYSTQENTVLTAEDIAGARRLYPHNPTHVADIIKERASILNRLQKSDMRNKQLLRNFE